MAALIAGCGGHTATKSDIVARANAICFNAQQALRELAPPTGGAGDLAGMSMYLNRLVPIVAREARQLRALPRPPQQRATLNRFIAAVSESVTHYRAAARAAAAQNSAGLVQALARLRTDDAVAAARSYGLTQCTGRATATA